MQNNYENIEKESQSTNYCLDAVDTYSLSTKYYDAIARFRHYNTETMVNCVHR